MCAGERHMCVGWGQGCVTKARDQDSMCTPKLRDHSVGIACVARGGRNAPDAVNKAQTCCRPPCLSLRRDPQDPAYTLNSKPCQPHLFEPTALTPVGTCCRPSCLSLSLRSAAPLCGEEDVILRPAPVMCTQMATPLVPPW